MPVISLNQKFLCGFYAIAILLSFIFIPFLVAHGAQMYEEDDGHGQSAAERTLNRAAGAWQGNWEVVRVDSRIRTLSGSRLFELVIIQDRGSNRAEVQWRADRAICEDPLDDPCEWVGTYGDAPSAKVTKKGGLQARFQVSADAEDPFILTIPHLPRGDAWVAGALKNTKGGLNYSVEIRRKPE